MIGLYESAPLFDALAVPLLVWMLVVGRTSPRRATQLVSLTAALALLVVLALLFAQQWLPGRIVRVFDSLAVFNLAVLVASFLVTLMGYAAWTLLLADAVRADDRRRLVGLTVVLALAVALEFALAYREPHVVQLLEALLGHLGTEGELVAYALQSVVAIVAVVVAFAFPATASTAALVVGTPRPPTSAPPAPPAPPTAS